jgi:hypothetical protein
MLLPKLEGHNFSNLKTDPLTAKNPVIVLGSLLSENEEKLMAARAAAYLEKSNLALDQSSSELSRMIAKLITLVPSTH